MVSWIEVGVFLFNTKLNAGDMLYSPCKIENEVTINTIYIAGTPREYLEHFVFPWLLPALEDMLRQAKKEKCLEVNFLLYFNVTMISMH